MPPASCPNYSTFHPLGRATAGELLKQAEYPIRVGQKRTSGKGKRSKGPNSPSEMNLIEIFPIFLIQKFEIPKTLDPRPWSAASESASSPNSNGFSHFLQRRLLIIPLLRTPRLALVTVIIFKVFF